jgi:hypothetical protein
MALDLLPKTILEKYHVEQRRHACAILTTDCPAEFKDVIECLEQFELLRSEIVAGGGGKTKIANRFDKFLFARGWRERSIKVGRSIDGETRESETHKVDFSKNRVAVEVEWNNKDPFYSRDLNAFRLLHELGVISVGVIVTRHDELQEIFDALPPVFDKKWKRWGDIGEKYGASTTHWSKLIPRIQAGEGGNCPLLLVGITRKCYRDDLTPEQRKAALQPWIERLKEQGITAEELKRELEKRKPKS